jgi:hypothetical protein
MPVKRRVAKSRARADDLSETAWALLTDQPPPDPPEAGGWEVFVLEGPGRGADAWGPTLEDLWAAHGAEITVDWAAERPGTRPSCWWRWTAPRAALGTRWGRYEFESQASYLRRHSLFLPGEERRLKAADFAPEAVLIDQAED